MMKTLLVVFLLILFKVPAIVSEVPAISVAPSPSRTSEGSVSVNFSASSANFSTPYVPSPYDVTSKFNPSMAIIVVVLLSAFFFMGFFSVYVRRCTTDDDFASFPFPDDHPNPFGYGGAGANRRSDRLPQGLDPFLLNRLPVVQFSRKLKSPPNDAECSVCLSAFEEDEALRLLPNCGHSFHQDCIDMWLFSHTTCPLCRRSLLLHGKNEAVNSEEEEDSEVLVPAPAADIAIDIQDSTTIVVREEDQDTTPVSEGTAADDPSSVRDQRDVMGFVQCGSPILGVMETPSGSKKHNRSCRGQELRRSHSTGHSLVKGAKDHEMNQLISSPSSDAGDPSACSPLFLALASNFHRSKSYTMLSNFHRSKSYTMLSNLQGVQQSEEQQIDMDLWAYPIRWLKKDTTEVGESSSSCSESNKGTKSASPSSSSSVRRTIRRLAGMDRTAQFFSSEHHHDFAQLAYVL